MRKTVFSEGEFYHIYNRGVDKRIIFDSDFDYKRFLAYLYVLNDEAASKTNDFFRSFNGSLKEVFNIVRKKPFVAIGAYCLMPNHFHLLVTPLVEGGISKFMQRVQTGYTMYFNEKNNRTGSLFQGTFKAEHADDDGYLKYLFSYIHLNPVKLEDPFWKEKGVKDLKKLRSFIMNYEYSSIKEYTLNNHVISTTDYFPSYFLKQADFEDHIDCWLENKNKTQKHIQKKPLRF